MGINKLTGILLLNFIIGFLFFNYNLDFSYSVKRSDKDNSSRVLNNLDYMNDQIGSQNPKVRAYKKIKTKENENYVEQEDPGALIEAIREIKTAFDGTTYSPNYRIKELKKAELKKSLLKISSVNEVLPWVERGPGNVSGRTRQLIVDPNDATGNTWFAATVGGGIWKTSNGGLNWENKTSDLTTLSVTSIAMAGSNHNVIYAGTGMGFGRVVDLAGNGLWKSIDHGETWTQLQSTANNELLAAINRIVVDPNDENIVLVCSNDDYTSYGPNGGMRKSGIFRTTDGGENWVQVYDPDIELGTTTDNRIQQIIANPQNFNTLYGSVNEVGVIKSLNGGLTWTVSADNFALPQDIGANEGTYQGISTRTELAIAPTDTTRLYAAVERPFGIADLYMTTNAGDSWTIVNDLGNDPNWFSGGGSSGAIAYTAGWFDNTIVVSPYDENVVFVGGVELYRININPSGATRSTTLIASVNKVHADHHDLKVIPVDQNTNQFKILDANDGGVAISNDGGITWQQIAGLRTTQFYGVDKKHGANEYFGGLQDNGTVLSSINPTANAQWTFKLGGDGFFTAWNYADPNLLIGCYQSGSYSRSSDGGHSWIAIPSALAGTNAPFISKLASSDIDPDLIFTVGNGGVNRSDDFGVSWDLISLGPNWLGFRAFDNVVISLADPQVVWATSRLDVASFIGKKGGIHVSNDGGLSYTEVSQNFPSNVTESSGFATHPSDPNTAYALFSAAGTPKILKTTNLGQSWQDISGFSTLGKTTTGSTNGYPDVATYSLLVMPYDNNIIWAGTEIGLFISQDGGATWNVSDNGLPRVGIFQMFIQDEQIVVSTYGRGIWTVNIPELINYTPPVATLSPRMNKLVQLTSGDVSIKVDLRSLYDSTRVIVNGQLFKTIESNSEITSEEILFSITQTATLNASAVAYKDGKEYKTPVKSITASPISVQVTYVNDFSSPNAIDDFSGDGFSVVTPSGFTNAALHSTHPYPEQSELIIRLKSPILVASNEAILEYDDIALIEPGIVDDYTNSSFYDYVIIEGTKDGINWLALAPGYDARYDAQWLNAYNSGLVGNDSNTPGDASMFKTHTINLLNTFSASDTIFIRFRLSSDALAVAWGWAIDNINIQNATEINETGSNVPLDFALEQNYPNPFNPSTNIKFVIPNASLVTLKVFDILGREVKELLNEYKSAGKYNVTFDATTFSSGIYLYQLKSNNFVSTRKMILIK